MAPSSRAVTGPDRPALHLDHRLDDDRSQAGCSGASSQALSRRDFHQNTPFSIVRVPLLLPFVAYFKYSYVTQVQG